MSTSTTRLLRLLSLLQSRRDWPGGLLADRLGITPRTVRRDVQRLREMGYAIRAIKGPDGGYRLEAGADMPPLLFDDDQAIALAVALRTAAASGVEVGEAALQALATVRQVLPARLRHRIDAVQVTAPALGDKAAGTAPDVLMSVSGAIQRREILRFRYAPTPGGGSDDSTAPPRRAEPHHLAMNGGRWYVVAWDLDRGAWRVFRLDRLSPLVATGRRFDPRTLPGGSVESFLARRFHGSVHGSAWPCTGSATVRLPAHEVAPFAADGTVEMVDDNRARVTLGSWSWAGLAAHLSRFDAEISDPEPAELREAFGALARRAAGAAGR